MTDFLSFGASNLSPLSPFVVILINIIGALIITTVVIRNSFQDKLTSVFVVMGALMFIWIDFAYLARYVGAENLFWAEVFLRIAWVATPPFFAYVYLITVHLLNSEKKLAVLNNIIVSTSIVLGAATAFSDYLIEGVAFSGPNLDIIYGRGFYVFLGVISLYILATLIPIFTGRVEDYRKRRVRVFVAGVIYFYIANLIFNITLPVFFDITHLYYFGDYSLLFLVGFTGYAIVRHRLLDIRTIVFRSVAFSVLTGLFYVVYGVVLYIVTKYLEAFELSPFQYSVLGITSFTIAFPAYLYYRRVLRRLTDRFLFQRRVDYQKALVKIGEELSGTIQIEEVTGSILWAMKEIVRVKKVAILLRDTQQNAFDLQAQDGMKNFDVTLQPDNVMLEHLKHEQRLITKDELILQKEKETSPAHIKEIEVIQNTLAWLDVAAVIPLFVHKELTGVILLGDKMSGEPYLEKDIEFLGALAPQAATALENARLYQESLRFGEKLKVEVKRATKELEDANLQLKNLDKAKSEFLSIASHQLRTPLTALRGYVSMLKEGDFGKVPKEQVEILDILDKSATRLIELINSLLDISRIESGRLELNLEAVDPTEMAEELVRDLLPNAVTKSLALEFHPPKKSISRVVVDKQRVRQVMLNFIDNAIKYTEKGRVDVYVGQEGDEVSFWVKDTGKGITKEELALLFNKFSRVGGAARFHTEGTGLGLYVARQIVQEHRGEVTADSPGEGKGSTFAMTLPAEGSPRSLKPGEHAEVIIKAADAQGQK